MARAPSVVSLIHLIKWLLRRDTFYGALESPRADTTVTETLLISGWTFSRRGPVTQVEAFLGPDSLGPVPSGLERLDVAQAFPWLDVARTGYELIVPLHPSVAGSRTVVVRVTDQQAHVQDYSHPIVVVPRVIAPPAMDIEQATWSGDTLTVAGWAVWREATPPITVSVRVGATEVAGGSIHLSRPDIAARFPGEPSALRSGFRLSVALSRAASGAVDKEAEVHVDLSDVRGYQHRHAIVIPHDARAERAVNIWRQLEDVVDRYQSRHGRLPAVLDWNAALDAAGSTRCLVFSPPVPSSEPVLPYADRTVDIVAVGRRGGDYVTEAMRVATAAVVVVDEGQIETMFAEKWSDTLSGRPVPPERLDRPTLYRHAVRDRRTRRALVWAPRVPEHDRESGSRRVNDTIRYLIEDGWAVTFVAECATGGERYVSMLEQMGVTVYAGQDTRWAGLEFLQDPTELLTVGAFDLAILHFWWIAERHLQSFRRHSPSTRVIVDSVDLAFLRRARSKYRGRADGLDVLDPGDAMAMMRELNVYAAADAVLTVSSKEAAVINDFFADGERAHVVPDAEDLRQSPVDFDERRGLLFLGNFKHTPNVEALAYLAREIVPRMRPDLLARHPISVVGNDLSESLVDQCGARADSIRLVGWVPSVEPYLEQTRITIVPLCHGAGTKRKLVQAAMMGTPSVTTSVGIEGLNLCDGEHVLVADSPAAFVDAIDKLVDDSVLWRRLALAGREAVLETHGREIVAARFNAVIERIAR